MNSNSKTNWGMAMMYAGTYIATLIGSGYATGQEIYQFFVSFGPAGFIGGIVSLLVFLFAGVELLSRGYDSIGEDPNDVYEYYTGAVFGKFLHYFVPFFLFAVYIIMISGAGATLEEYYGMNPYTGRILMSVVVFITVLLGIEKIVQVLGNIGPVIIVFTIIVCVYNLSVHYDNLPVALEFYKTAEIAKPTSNAYLGGLMFPSYNMLTIIGLLASIGQTADNKKTAIWGGILGALGVGVTSIVMYAAMFVQLDQISHLTIPTLYMADQISPIAGKIFSVILLLGIYTSAVPMLWQSVNRIAEDDSPRFKWVVLAGTILGLLLGLLPFDVLVGTIYPYVGYLGLLTLILMAIKAVRVRVSK